MRGRNEPKGLCRGVGAWIAFCVSRSSHAGTVRMPEHSAVRMRAARSGAARGSSRILVASLCSRWTCPSVVPRARAWTRCYFLR